MFGQTAASRYELYPHLQHNLKMGIELLPEASVNIYNLTRLSARVNFVVFCRRESSKPNENILPTDMLLRMSAHEVKIELFRRKLILGTRKTHGDVYTDVTSCPNFLYLQCRVEGHIAMMSVTKTA